MIFKYIHYIYTYHVYTQYTHVLSLHVAVHNMWMMPQRDGEICSACFLKQNLGIHKGLVSQKIGISWDIPFYGSTGSIFVTFSLQMLRQHLLLEFAVFLVSHILYIYMYTYAVCTRLHPMHIFCGHTAQIGRSNPHGRPRLALFFMLHFVDYAACQIKSKSSSIHILLSFLKSVIRNMYTCNYTYVRTYAYVTYYVYIYIRVYRIV
jgi:hypothetical protein